MSASPGEFIAKQTPWFSERYGQALDRRSEDHALCSGEQAFQKFDDNRGVDAA
jgi:hypothetical protein